MPEAADIAERTDQGKTGGLISPSVAVSSNPFAGMVQCVARPLSAAVTSRLPHIPDPVPYSTCPESKGSMARAPIQ